MNEHLSQPISTQAWAQRLAALGLAVRDAVTGAQQRGDELAAPVAQEGGDTIFAVDRHVEPVIERVIAQWPDACKPLTVVAEGLGEDGRQRFEPAQRTATNGESGFRVLIDPIDGTRNIMYDKRSAWFIAAVCADAGESTRLSSALASTMVELPASKAAYGDVFGATHDDAPWGRRVPIDGDAANDGDRAAALIEQGQPLTLRPSAAPTLRNGFGQVSNFFPGTKVLASELMERIVEATLGEVEPGSAAVFDDQYITTAGQMVELMLGHDRFCCDLRPLFYDVLSKRRGQTVRGLECHPYDLAGALVAQRAGVVLTDGWGRALDAPLDVHSPAHWCGYANEQLKQQIEPIIQQWFREKGVTQP